MKTISLLVHDDPGQEARIAAAIVLARAIEGHVQCIDLLAIVTGRAWPDDAAGIAMLFEHELTRESANKQALQIRLNALGIGWTWTEATGDLFTCVNEASATTNVIVVNSGSNAWPYRGASGDVAKLIARSAHPVVAVPAISPPVFEFEHALVCWNGSIGSMHAAVAALPLLRVAARVHVLEIDDGTIDAPAEEVALFLAQHGIHATIVRQGAADRQTARAIMPTANDLRADYIVLGGYGHGRRIEAVFGGVTATLLEHTTLPLFLAH